MAIKKRIKSLSNLTRELLAEGESVRSDFKRSPEGITADDLVAFANSEAGGQVLIGVDEHVVDKAQIGIVRGCDVSDAAVLQILNKAISCIPPVLIEIYIENLDDRPILRVEIPPSQTKPHCTPKGIYCRRDGTRNRPLHPSELLRLFLDSEASAFAERFVVAAERITDELNNLESSLDSSIQSMSDQLGWADYQLGDTESTLHHIQGLVAKLTEHTDDTNSRLRALFRQDKREDPVRQKSRIRFVNRRINEIRENDELFAHVVAGGKLSLNDKQPKDSDINDEDAKSLLDIAVRHVHETERDKSYQIFVKSPKNCSDEELDQFVKKVTDSGGVADGILGRAKRALRLGFIVYDDVIVGTAVLNKPTAGYRAKIFKKANSQLDPTAYQHELAWIFLDVAHREKGQMTRLIKDILSVAKDSALFATTPASNDIMKKILVQEKFSENGTEYKFEHNADHTLKLFIRNVPEIQTTG